MRRIGRTALLLVILLAACVRPWPRPAGPSAPDTVRIIAYNIHHGEGQDGVLDLERIGALIRRERPDLVALQEVDRNVERTRGVDQAAVLARLTGMEAAFGMFMPYQGGEYGMAVLSAWPILERWNHRLPDGAEPRSAVTVRVRSPGGREIVFAGIHFYRTEEERLAQARALADSLARIDDPAVLAGDFNSQPGSAVLDFLAADWWVLPKAEDRFTFPSDGADREIDFVMVRPRARFELIEQRVIDEPIASDHRPVLAVLVVR